MKAFKNILGIILIIPIFWSCEPEPSVPDSKILSFDGTSNGKWPLSDLTFDGTFFYGTTSAGGANDMGTIFKIMPDGSGYVKLLDFAGTTNGSTPRCSLVCSSTYLYGMTSEGGSNNFGTVFKIKTDGTGYTKLLDFSGTVNGSHPYGSLIFDGTFLYGTTYDGGANTLGTIFKIMTDGTGYVKLLDFAGPSNGGHPRTSLMSDGTFLYGTTIGGGANSHGTIFKIMPNGSGYVKLYDFGAYPVDGNNSSGALIYDGTFLYGTTAMDGALDNSGTVFKIKPDGSSYTTLINFSDAAVTGRSPSGALFYDGTFLYATASADGANNKGVLFKIKPDGSSFTKLIDFSGSLDGGGPCGAVTLEGGYLYGTAFGGGANNLGAIFRFKL